MVLAHEGYQAFGQADESDAQGALVDDGCDGVARTQLVGTVPQYAHYQRKLLGIGRLLELQTVVELLCGHLQHVVELGKEGGNAVLLILDVHALDGQSHDVDGAERKVAAADAGLGPEPVLEDACAASHGGTFPLVALGVVGLPVVVLVVGGIQIDEVGEEAACGHLTCELVEVIVAVGGQVAHASFLLPYLDGEDGCFAIAYAFVGAAQEFADDATAFCAGVGSVVDAAEDHLIAAPAVDGVHVVDKGLHGLVYTAHGLVDGMLQDAFASFQSVERFLQKVLDGCVIQFAVVLGHELLQHFHLLDERGAHIGCQVEVEGRDGLSAVHLVLGCFHADTAEDAGRFDAFGRTALSVPGLKTVGENLVERMLYAGEAFGGVVVLVVDVEVVAPHGFACVLREQVVIDERLGGFAAELHHHAGRGVGIHVGIFAGHIVVFDIDDFQEDVACLCLSGHASCITVLDVGLGHLLACTFHQFVFHQVLDVLHGHLAFSAHGDAVGYLPDERFVLTFGRGEHGFADGGSNLLLVESHDSSISLHYGLYHWVLYLLRLVFFLFLEMRCKSTEK